MLDGTATARGVVAALAAALLGLPAAGLASGGTSGDSGGGATYYETDAADAPIALRAPSGAWVGRRARVRGNAEELAGGEVVIERRRSARRGWVPIRTVPVAGDGTFSARWRPTAAGRHQLRAVSANASSAESTGTAGASEVRRVTVYRRVTATWYGPGFYGNRTACGQRLTRSTQGVAHKTLPCGTKVAVRVNGRSTVVPVIDRGPYARGVAYDLAAATAKRLGVAHTVRIGAAVVSR